MLILKKISRQHDFNLSGLRSNTVEIVNPINCSMDLGPAHSSKNKKLGIKDKRF